MGPFWLKCLTWLKWFLGCCYPSRWLKPMVIQQRLQTLADFVRNGREMRITFCFNVNTGKFKAKADIEAHDDVVPVRERVHMAQVVAAMQRIALGSITVDHGHHFSSGKSYMKMWSHMEGGGAGGPISGDDDLSRGAPHDA